MTQYRRIILWRNAFVIIQLGAIIGFLVLFAYRSQSAPIASAKLDAEHSLTPADMVCENSKPLIGKVLRKPILEGSPITADLVKDSIPIARPTTSVAAVVIVNESIAKKRGLAVGSKVSVSRSSLPDLPGTLIARNCDNQNCIFVVALGKLPQNEPLDLQSFATAELLPTPSQP